MSDPKGFMKFKRENPLRRAVDERIHDWNEFYNPLSVESLKNQGARCMDCGVPFCQSKSGCPVENVIPDWNDLVHRGRWKEALKVLHATNNFPEFTGKLCPAPCESACVLGVNPQGDEPVSIRVIESSIIDHGFNDGLVDPILPVRETGKKIAIIGSGPAGLAASQQLRRSGHQVFVYEKADQVGGLLRYGIPDFKLEKWVLDRRLEQLKAEGVIFRTGINIGVDVKWKDLESEYDLIGIAIGAEQPRDLLVPGRDFGGIHFAMDYLIQQNRLNAKLPLMSVEPSENRSSSEKQINAAGKRVVIIGGGDTGSDCLGTAIRQGCKSVMQFELMAEPRHLKYPERDPSTPWPMWPMQLRTSHAHEEGGDRLFSVSTTKFSGENGIVRKLHGLKVELKNGGFTAVSGSDFEMDVDLVLLAMGFSGPTKSPLLCELEGLGVQLDQRGNIKTNETYSAGIPKVFAAGDARRGASLIVWAIAEGRKMAAAMDLQLKN